VNIDWGGLFAGKSIIPKHSVCFQWPHGENYSVAATTRMKKEATDIEAEVLEIDGVVPTRTPEQNQTSTPEGRGDWQDWRQWGGRVRRLDSRWWPLWTLLCVIAFVLVVTVGLVAAVLFLIFRVIRALVQSITGTNRSAGSV